MEFPYFENIGDYKAGVKNVPLSNFVYQLLFDIDISVLLPLFTKAGRRERETCRPLRREISARAAASLDNCDGASMHRHAAPTSHVLQCDHLTACRLLGLSRLATPSRLTWCDC